MHVDPQTFNAIDHPKVLNEIIEGTEFSVLQWHWIEHLLYFMNQSVGKLYRGKLPLICFNCDGIGHFSNKCPVTPCFPQSVKITILAKYCGKLGNVNVWCEWTLWKRSMNVNDIINIYSKTVERGCVEKETTMVAESRWKAPGKVVLTSTKNQYRIWTSLARRTKRGLLALN